MCEIIDIKRLNNDAVISCSPYNGPFVDSSTLKIFNSKDDLFTTTEFTLDRTRQCFNNNARAPVVLLKTQVPETFLSIGNKIEFA